MTREELDDWIARSRAGQGLPPKIDDPDIIAKVAALIDTWKPQEWSVQTTGA